MFRLTISLTRALALVLALVVGPASAQMTTLMAGGTKGATSPPTLSFVSQLILNNSGSTRTNSTANIGNPTYIATRRVIIACGSNSSANGPITGATINGVTATVHLDYEPANVNWLTIFSALVPTGTTNVTVTITYSSTQFAASGCGVYNVDNSLLSSTTPNTGTATSAASVTSLATSSISTLAGGFIIAVASIGAGSTGLAFTGLTTDAFGGTAAQVVSSLGSLSGGSLTPTATWGTSQTASVAAAAWR